MRNKILFIFLPLLFLYSCSNLFVQKSVFVPLLKNKGETKVDASFGREGIGVNTAYAFTNCFSVMANGFSAFDNSTEYKNRYNYQAEFGLGYYKTFQDSFIYESFFGASRGWLNSTYDRSSFDFSRYYELGIFSPVNGGLLLLNIPTGHSYSVNGYGNYYTTFMQHSFGMDRTLTNWNSFIWTLRLQYVKFDKYSETILLNNQQLLYNVFAPDKVFIQFMLADKIGITNDLVLSLQLGINFDATETSEAFEWNKVFCYAGFEYTFQMKHIKKMNHKVLFKRKYKNIFQKRY